MRRARKRALFWHGVGWLCYLVGLVLCLFTAVGIYLAAPSGSLENASSADLALLVGGASLIVGGRVVTMYQVGSPEMVPGTVEMIRNQGPEQSRLEELGYHIPPEASKESHSDFAYEDGEVRVVCEECGEHNESNFEFCRRCSEPLPE